MITPYDFSSEDVGQLTVYTIPNYVSLSVPITMSQTDQMKYLANFCHAHNIGYGKCEIRYAEQLQIIKDAVNILVP